MGIKSGVTIVLVLIVIVGSIFCFDGLIGKNEAVNWQMKQSLGGKVSIQDKPGFYFKWFATVTTYPRYVSQKWNDIADEGIKTKESIRTTFNDGGTAQVSTDMRYATPISTEQRVIFHQQFSGNIKNATTAVKSHLTNCIKATGPLMSASEHQSARKAEFTQLVEDQTVNGLYTMERIEKVVTEELTDEQRLAGIAPKKIAILKTNLMLDDNGLPKVAKVSPLKIYGISVLQFSITQTEYDKETLKQFAAKKQSFLAAEQSKADKIKFAQAKMATVAEYAQQIAVVKGKAEMTMMTQTTDAKRDKELAEINAAKKVAVALLTKEEAETIANMALSVADIAKQEALTVANKNLEVATIEASAAQQRKLATIADAEGREKAIKLSGAITEKERVLATIEAEKMVQIAVSLKDIKTPNMIINGGSGGSGGVTMPLINIAVMKAAGILPADFSVTEKTVRPVAVIATK